jgi:hypothetical protein
MYHIKENFTLLNRTDYFLLLSFFFEVLSESIVQSNLLFYLTENLNVSYGTTVLILAGVSGAESAVVILFGRVFDTYPHSGPLRILSYANPIRIASILCLLAIEVIWGINKEENRLILPLVSFILIAFFGIGDGCTALVFSLTIAEKTEKERDRKSVLWGLDRIRSILFSLQYGLLNLAIILSSLITYLWRSRFAYNIKLGNDAILLTGIWIWLASTAFASWLSIRLPARMHRRKSIKSFTGLAPVPPTSILKELGSLQMHQFIMLWLAMLGVLATFSQLSMTTPKYLVFRHDLVAEFALMQIINPGIIVLLTLILPFIPGIHRLSSVTWLIIGTTVQGLSPLWEWALGGTIKGTILFLVQFTIGEAVGIPNLGSIQLSIIPPGTVGLYKSIAQIPAIALGFSSNALSATFMSLLCTDAIVCKQDSAPLIWLCVSILCLATPISLLVYYYGTRRTDADDTI